MRAKKEESLKKKKGGKERGRGGTCPVRFSRGESRGDRTAIAPPERTEHRFLKRGTRKPWGERERELETGGAYTVEKHRMVAAVLGGRQRGGEICISRRNSGQGALGKGYEKRIKTIWKPAFEGGNIFVWRGVLASNRGGGQDYDRLHRNARRT